MFKELQISTGFIIFVIGVAYFILILGLYNEAILATANLQYPKMWQSQLKESLIVYIYQFLESVSCESATINFMSFKFTFSRRYCATNQRGIGYLKQTQGIFQQNNKSLSPSRTFPTYLRFINLANYTSHFASLIGG